MRHNNHAIYLDYQATTPIDPCVLDSMLPYLTCEYGNPASSHSYGRRAASALRTARRQLGELIGTRHDNEIVFTSGATEANHLAITGVTEALRERNARSYGHVITTTIEHKAVLATCQNLTRHGHKITIVPVGHDGIVDPADIAAAMTADTVLVSVMHANNEIGTVQPLAEIAAIAHGHGAVLHTDAAQSLGTLPFNADTLGIDLASFSGHKIYGPKGVGALYVRWGSIRPRPQLLGGGQEHGLRAGTPNVPGIVGLGTAAKLLTGQRNIETRRIGQLAAHLLDRLCEGLPELQLNGSLIHRLPGNLNITIPGTDAGQLVGLLPGLAISTGSACNTGQAAPSHVLTAIGLERRAARSTLRISIGRPTTVSDVDSAAGQLIAQTRAMRSAA